MSDTTVSPMNAESKDVANAFTTVPDSSESGAATAVAASPPK